MASLTPAEPVAFKWDKPFYLQAAETGLFDGRHIEPIEGEIIEMSPIGNPHDAAVSLLQYRLSVIFPFSQYYVRVQMGFDTAGQSVPEPDIAVVRGTPFDYLEAKPQEAESIVEVSESSLVYDLGLKTGLYARGGIPRVLDRKPGRPHAGGLSVAIGLRALRIP